MKDSACMAIQYCDKTQLKVYGTCEFQVWFWVIIAVAAVALVVFSVLLSCWLKKRSSRNTPEESEELRPMHLNQVKIQTKL